LRVGFAAPVDARLSDSALLARGGAIDTQRCGRQGTQPRFGDRLAAPAAHAVRALRDAVERHADGRHLRAAAVVEPGQHEGVALFLRLLLELGLALRLHQPEIGLVALHLLQQSVAARAQLACERLDQLGIHDPATIALEWTRSTPD